MNVVRRIKIGKQRYKLKPLAREQKKIVVNNNYKPDEWLFVSESDSCLRIVKKDSLDGKPRIETLYK